MVVVLAPGREQSAAMAEADGAFDRGALLRLAGCNVAPGHAAPVGLAEHRSGGHSEPLRGNARDRFADRIGKSDCR
jgi:hypothetical protein